MLERKKKKHGYAELLKCMHLLESGNSIKFVSTEHGINNKRLRVLWEKYQRYGVSGLQKEKNIKADFALKRQIVLDIEKNHLTLHAASLKYGASLSSITTWLRLYRENGWIA